MSDTWHSEAEVDRIPEPVTIDIDIHDEEVFRLGQVFKRTPQAEVAEVLRSDWGRRQGWSETDAGQRFERTVSADVSLVFVFAGDDVRLIRHARARVVEAAAPEARRRLEAAVRAAVSVANEQCQQVITRALLLVNHRQTARFDPNVRVSEVWTSPHRVRQTLHLNVPANVRELVTPAS